MSHLVPFPEDHDPNDPSAVARHAEREAAARKERLTAAWAVVREETGPGPIVRQIDRRSVHYSAPGISVIFEFDHLAGLEATTAMLRSMLGR